MITIYIAEYHRFGGSQRAMLGCVRELMARGEEVQVVFPGRGTATEWFERAGVPLVVLATPPSLNQFGGAVLRAGVMGKARTTLAAAHHSYQVYRLMKASKSKVLHCNTTRSTLMAAAVPRLLRLRTVWHMRAQAHAAGPLVHRLCVLLSSDRIAICEDSLSELPKSALERTVVIYDGVDVEACRVRAAASPADLNGRCDGGSPTSGALCMVASLTPFKGQHRLLEAVALLRDVHGLQPCVFLIGSASPTSHVEVQYEAYLRDRSSELGLRHVHFLGWLDDPLPWVAACDLLVLPSLSHDRIVLDGRDVEVRGGEAFPAVVLEAMALSRPVVATRNAGIPEQVKQGVTGVLVDQRSDLQLADAVASLLRDNEARTRLGLAGAARVEAQFSRALTIDGLVDLYRRISA